MLEQIKEALEKATPGPWNKEGEELWHRGGSYAGNSPHAYIGDLKMMQDRNAHLIANSPTWLQYLLSAYEEAQRGHIYALAKVEVLKRDNELLEEVVTEAQRGKEVALNSHRYVEEELIKAQREIERLNTALHTHKSYDLTVSDLIEENRKLHTENTAMKSYLLELAECTSSEMIQSQIGNVLSTLSKKEIPNE